MTTNPTTHVVSKYTIVFNQVEFIAVLGHMWPVGHSSETHRSRITFLLNSTLIFFQISITILNGHGNRSEETSEQHKAKISRDMKP